MENRQETCKYIHSFMGKNHDETHCVAGGWEDDKVKTVTPEDCEKCDKYKSRFIEYPITVSKINSNLLEYWKDENCGKLVKIRPCGKEYENNTYLGILLGDLPFMLYITHNPETLELSCSTTENSAIFVPELKKIIFGMESWWSEIKSEEELKEITDDDIENIWYVKMLKWMEDREDGEIDRKSFGFCADKRVRK